MLGRQCTRSQILFTVRSSLGPLGKRDTESESRKPGLAGERRHLTVLFCDLVGSTEIAARLDPEEWREVIGSYHRAATEAITRYGGHVAQYLGDGVMAYFGWPEAHENDAERAARAGLAILEAVSQLNQKPMNLKISLRVGIDSGAVVVGPGAGKDADVFGETPNIAARVQTAAAPDTVLITGATHRLLSGLFVVEERGAQELKGVANPVQLYRVLRPSGVRGRLAAARGLTPFVGREEELRLLLSRWEHARDGEGQLVLVIGEAGIGKSRLVAEFHDRIRDTPHSWMESAGEPFFENSPFHAVTEMLSQWLDLKAPGEAERTRANEPARCASEKEQLDHLDRVLVAAGLKPEDSVALIADLLPLRVGERYPAIALAPEQRRRRLLAALTGWVFGAARLQPVVMVIEDLHWLDPSTLELVQLWGEQGVTVPLMMICTARPEFHPQWPMRSHHTQITLNRLSVHDVREMVAQVAARNALNNQSIDTVIERTGGNPLFVEELTRAVLESGGMSARAIPVTLHDSLMARLDRLGSAKSVLQLASVIGGEFSYELLHALQPGTESELESELHKLTDADLLYFRGIAPEAIYEFKHALIRDAAYEALLKSRRKELHRLVARAIDERFSALKQAHPEVLARHWTEAGEAHSAINEWSKAGQGAEALGAFSEAQGNYEQALALFKLLPESPERDLRELELSQSLLGILPMTSGYAAPEILKANARATALAEKTGNLAQLVNLVIFKGRTTFAAGNFAAAAILADQALEIAHRDGSPTNLALAYELQIMVRHWRGDLTGAEDHFEAGLKFFDDPGFRQAMAGTARPNAFGEGAWNAWLLGRPELARKRIAEALAGANQSNPAELAWADFHAGGLHCWMREYEQAQRLHLRSLELSEKFQIPDFIALNRCNLAYVRAYLGDTNEGIDLLAHGITRAFEHGLHIGDALLTTRLAEAQALAGAFNDALHTVERALLVHPEELLYRPEALRLRGELRLKQAQSEPAEADFREALALTCKMGARSLELRATMSLARLLASQGRRDEARAMLAEIYNWFTEGFDTADLKVAKALLDELSR